MAGSLHPCPKEQFEVHINGHFKGIAQERKKVLL